MRYRCQYPSPIYRRRWLMECSTSTTAKRRDVIARVLGRNGGVVNTGDDVREAASALRWDPRKRMLVALVPGRTAWFCVPSRSPSAVRNAPRSPYAR
jgi:hypothetical protein